MKKVWLLRLIIIATLWLGLGILVWEGIANQEILWQAGVFTILLLIGATLENLVTYKGDPYLLPTVQLLLVIGLIFITRIWPNSAIKQFHWACLGLLIYYIVLYALRDYRILGRFRYLSGLGAVVLLLITLLF
ncbi:MAG: FtsW/RodA/SpoVE family cell cycle protein, partial [Desulfitobacterium sp.]|nr:FtsW/RodA/SpoVE family cell cycle protein [Desulfitobacterium sp.]